MKTIINIILIMAILIGSASGATITSGLNVTVTSSQVGPWMVGNSSYNQTLTLLDAAATNLKGKEFTFNVGTNPGTKFVRLTGTGGDHIGGADVFSTTDYPANVVLYSDGTNWQVKSSEGLWWADGIVDASVYLSQVNADSSLDMGTYNLTAGNVNADAVYSKGQLQGNQTQAYECNIYQKDTNGDGNNDRIFAEAANGTIVANATVGTECSGLWDIVTSNFNSTSLGPGTYTRPDIHLNKDFSINGYPTMLTGAISEVAMLYGGISSPEDIINITGPKYPAAKRILTIKNVKFYYGDRGIIADNADLDIQQCSFYYTHGSAIDYNTTYGSNIIQNWFFSCGDIADMSPAIKGRTVDCTNIHIQRNTIEMSPYADFVGYLRDSSDISYNYFEGNWSFCSIYNIGWNYAISYNCIGDVDSSPVGMILYGSYGEVNGNSIKHMTYGIENHATRTNVHGNAGYDLYRFYVENSPADHNRVHENTFGASESPSVIGGNTRLYHNIDYITESPGARLLLTGTSQAVAHGLAITPTNQSINVVKESSGTDWWFSAAPTSTNFYLNGTAGKYVDWSIN
jgi:hypothetical protein